jgi:ribosomal protein S12 methylthiotransferase
MQDLVPDEVARQRHRKLMTLQRPISRRKLRERVGEELEVLVDGVSDESDFLMEGRWWGQAPEVDGKMYLANGTAQAGDFRQALVTAAADYDLVADLLTGDGAHDSPPDGLRPSRRRVKLKTIP